MLSSIRLCRKHGVFFPTEFWCGVIHLPLHGWYIEYKIGPMHKQCGMVIVHGELLMSLRTLWSIKFTYMAIPLYANRHKKPALIDRESRTYLWIGKICTMAETKAKHTDKFASRDNSTKQLNIRTREKKTHRKTLMYIRFYMHVCVYIFHY